MNTYSVKIETKLGKSLKRKIVAHSEEEAEEKARQRFPLLKTVEVFDSRESSASELRHEEHLEKPKEGARSGGLYRRDFSFEELRSKEYAKGKRRMWTGATWVVLGGLATAATYYFSLSGRFYVLWGAVAYGLADFGLGYWAWKANRLELGEKLKGVEKKGWESYR
ncbi:MAG: hypothetical protein AAGB46_09260 [Verrucomicrobiota bacterium]